MDVLLLLGGAGGAPGGGSVGRGSKVNEVVSGCWCERTSIEIWISWYKTQEKHPAARQKEINQRQQ